MFTTEFSRKCVEYIAAIVLVAGVVPFLSAGPMPPPRSERELIEVLQTKTPPEKAIACKQLAIYGTKDSVPELAKLLADPELSSWSRIAMEAIPGPEADAALLKATDSVKGLLLVGTINSIGVRKDAGAVDRLSVLLKDEDSQVASASAVALGRVGNDAATQALRKALPGANGAVRSAVAEGCILCAEKLIAAGKAGEAAAIYDEVRKADVPKQRKLEATRGAILARKTEGIPLLVEQLRSSDKAYFQIGLMTARQLAGSEVADALAGELSSSTSDRAALLVSALMDRKDAALPKAVLAVAKTGDKELRKSALAVIGRRGDAACLPTLLEIASASDAELADAAKVALAALPDKKVEADIVSQLKDAQGKKLAVLLDAVGRRRIDARKAVVQAISSPDTEVRAAALAALGETAGPEELRYLISRAVFAADHPENDVQAWRALKAACVRMPDRDECASRLSMAMLRSSTPQKVKLVEILGAVGGQNAVNAIASAMKSGGDAELQDAGSRVLGQWMSVEAGPALLDLAKDPAAEKYHVRALRGYIRLARQFSMPDNERAAMCQNALDAAPRTQERQLILQVLERYPSMDTLKVAGKATQSPALKSDSTRVTLAIIDKLGNAGHDRRELLKTANLEPMKVEIVQADYGAGGTQKDVTKSLQKQVHELPLITLSSPSYNDSFGGDPVPGIPKQLKVKYRIDGKVGEASFSENAVILLPTPK